MPVSKQSLFPPSGYFTCTLGEAIQRSSVWNELQTVNDLINRQAKLYPQNVAAGFPVSKKDHQEWAFETFSMLCRDFNPYQSADDYSFRDVEERFNSYFSTSFIGNFVKETWPRPGVRCIALPELC